MRTLSKIMFATMFSIGLVSSAVKAAPGDAQEEQRLTVLDLPKEHCSVRPGLCMRAGASSTRPSASLLVGAAGAPLDGGESSLFLRVLPDGPSRQYDEDAVPWTLDVQAALPKPAVPGNALFILTDLQDPEQAAADSHTVTALYQAAIPGGARAAVRLVLHPQDGFRAGHTYRLRVVQILSGKEVELASGEVGLL